MTLSLLDKFISFCHKNNLLATQEHVVIGCSGGPDSLCLLHLLRELAAKLDLTLTAAHLNHQLRAEQALEDERFVRSIAERWRIPLFVERQDIAKIAEVRKLSIEEAARQARYTFLGRVATEIEAQKVAVGHQADDQTETILMHLLRGSGLEGLRGMLPQTQLPHPLGPVSDRTKTGAVRDRPKLSHHKPAISARDVQLIRPLLEISRVEIEAYCLEHQLSPRQDSSNQDTTFFRNRLRHELIPVLESYNPNIGQNLQKLAKIVRAEVELLQGQVQQTWQTVVKDKAAEWLSFDLDLWLALPLALKRATLRRAIQTLRADNRDISFDHIETAIALVEKRKSGTKATLPRNLQLTMEYDRFVIADQGLAYPFSKAEFPYLYTDQPLPVIAPGVTLIPESDWQLRANILPKNELDAGQSMTHNPWEAYLDADIVGLKATLRVRQPGDYFAPLGLPGSQKKIKSFMIDEQIPATRRAVIPLLVAKGQILWVCGYRLSEKAKITTDSTHILHLKFEQIE